MLLDLNQDLLAFLRRTLNSPGIAFWGQPEEIALGTEARIVKFTLRSAPRKFARPFVLRISTDREFPINPGLEHAVQNAVFDQGFPAPRVLASSMDGAELGAPFTIMTHVASRPTSFGSFVERGINRMQRALGSDSMNMVNLSHRELQIKTLAWLHNLDGRGLGKMFEAHGVRPGRLTESTRFAQARGMIDTWALDSLRPLMEWLATNDPVGVGTGLSICHGDPHEGNLMFAGGKVVGVFDWGEAGLRPPESDLGLLCGYRRCTEPLSTPLYDQQKFNEHLLAAYERYRPADEKLVRYYEAEVLVNFIASVAVQQRRRAAGRHPPGNPVLDNPETFGRLTRRLRFLVGRNVFMPENFAVR